MRKHTANDSNKIIKLNTTTGNKDWTFSPEAKFKYPDLRRVVKEANRAVEDSDVIFLKSALIGVGEQLEGRGSGGSRRDLDDELCRVVRQIIEAETQRFIRGLFLHGNGKTTLKEAVVMTHGK